VETTTEGNASIRVFIVLVNSVLPVHLRW